MSIADWRFRRRVSIDGTTLPVFLRKTFAALSTWESQGFGCIEETIISFRAVMSSQGGFSIEKRAWYCLLSISSTVGGSIAGTVTGAGAGGGAASSARFLAMCDTVNSCSPHPALARTTLQSSHRRNSPSADHRAGSNRTRESILKGGELRRTMDASVTFAEVERPVFHIYPSVTIQARCRHNFRCLK